MGVFRIFQRGGGGGGEGGTHRVIQRVITRLSPVCCRLFPYKKAYKEGGGGSWAPQDPPRLRH